MLDLEYLIPEAISIDIGEMVSGMLGQLLCRERDSMTPKSIVLTFDKQRIQELEARIKRLEEEKRILKKATAPLMSDEFKNMCG